MLNSKPNNKNYHQGNFIPTYKDKVLKLNTQGGIYYRSSLEIKVMKYLDNNPNIIKWGAECLSIPYQLTHYETNGDINLKKHTYYPDFYYEIKSRDGSIKQIIAEVKPMKEFLMVQKLNEMNFKIPDNPTLKNLKNIEYDIKMAQKNSEKWAAMIKFCDKKGYNFIIITEETLKKFSNYL